MVNAHVEVPERGEPHIAGRRLPVLSVALQISGTDVTVEEYARGRELDVADVTAALSWAANHKEQMDEAIRQRAESIEEMSDREYPDGVAGAGDVDVEDYQRRVRRTLAEVVKDWQQYDDTQWGGDREE